MGLMVLVTLLIALFGWLSGAIINYVADVLPVYRKLVQPVCPHCTAKTNFARYLLFRRCNDCGRSFSLRHWIVIFAVPLIFIYISLRLFASPLDLVQNLVIVLFFSLVIVIDIEHHLILHVISLIGAVSFIWIGWTQHGWLNTMIGGSVGLGVMLLLYFIGYQFSKMLSKRRGSEVEEGLGFGDVILGCVCGLLLGWPGISVGLFSGILLGGIYSLGLVIYTALKKQYEPFTAIPYGPFLAIAAMALWSMR
jgi:leader peptidase (prepilin peptidase) / N-methyltransferase